MNLWHKAPHLKIYHQFGCGNLEINNAKKKGPFNAMPGEFRTVLSSPQHL